MCFKKILAKLKLFLVFLYSVEIFLQSILRSSYETVKQDC